MATLTLTIRPAVLSAVQDIFNTSDLVSVQNIQVLDNDFLGVEPTVISSIDTSGFTLGTITMNVDHVSIDFTPNGNIGTSSFKYKISDDIGRFSESSVIITTT